MSGSTSVKSAWNTDGRLRFSFFSMYWMEDGGTSYPGPDVLAYDAPC